ncbi:exosome complex protein Rrp42 [Hyperthermus butylicus]|uniref:Exosome complex component Rrp42 n=1 Tax=Hyperthermus butylicus (strain DSM 5456 / JCM 9403 / PLM1-5) TaxID=415426 RepID=A2BKC1_HYPBU|nr:exosome complex protein Rrp42 [Hyperthermus butylicus]ABM80432.1 RNase PH-related exoribonuclease [Hyperthermus butylicus DSM 5456]
MSITPSFQPVIPKLKKHTMETLLSRGVRLDGRKLDETRPVEITPGYIDRAEGSALVKLGQTVVLAGVKTDIVAPFPDTPNEAVLVVHAEFVPLASPTFEPGPPDENAIELARVIDRSLREIKAVALDKLVLEPGKHVWRLYVDLYILNHDGNLFDASMLAAMAALMTTRLPAAVKTEDGYTVDRSKFTGLVPVNHKVVTVTIAKLSNRLIVDPTYEEEQVADTRLVVAVSDDGRIAGIQKTGMGDLTYKEVLTAVAIALNKAQVYLKALEEKVVPYRAELEKKLAEQAAGATPAAAVPAPAREHEEVVEQAESAGEETVEQSYEEERD